jgi:hypothetical protein
MVGCLNKFYCSQNNKGQDIKSQSQLSSGVTAVNCLLQTYFTVSYNCLLARYPGYTRTVSFTSFNSMLSSMIHNHQILYSVIKIPQTYHVSILLLSITQTIHKFCFVAPLSHLQRHHSNTHPSAKRAIENRLAVSLCMLFSIVVYL